MVYGLRVINPATGSKQIDESYFNPALISKQTITSSSTRPSGFSSDISYASITITSTTFPLLAVACAYHYAPIGVTRSGNNWTFGFYVFGFSRALTCYIFGVPPTLGAGWGLRVKKSGQIMFDSRHRYLRRIARFGLSSGTLSPGRTYASMISNSGLYYTRQVQLISPSFWRVTEAMAKGMMLLEGNTYAYEQISINSLFYETATNPGASSSYTSASQQASIIDVTGY